MNEALAATVLLLGIAVGALANYLAWASILAARRRTRIRRLSESEHAPEERGMFHGVSATRVDQGRDP